MGNKPSSSTEDISDSSTKEILRSLKLKSRCLSHCIEEQSGRLQSTRREFPFIVEDYSLQTIKIAHSEMEEMEYLDMKDDDINIHTNEPEFCDWKWLSPYDLVELAVPFKRNVYKDVLAAFAPILI